MFISNHPEVRRILSEKGLRGIVYKNCVPDFSPVAEATVSVGYMSGRNSRGSHKKKSDANSNERELLQVFSQYEDAGTYHQADALLAEKKNVTRAEIKKYRQNNKLTWHEKNDMTTVQLIPTIINRVFRHLGGIAEIKLLREIAYESDLDEIDFSDFDEEYD